MQKISFKIHDQWLLVEFNGSLKITWFAWLGSEQIRSKWTDQHSKWMHFNWLFTTSKSSEFVWKKSEWNHNLNSRFVDDFVRTFSIFNICLKPINICCIVYIYKQIQMSIGISNNNPSDHHLFFVHHFLIYIHPPIATHIFEISFSNIALCHIPFVTFTTLTINFEYKWNATTS